MKSMNPGEWHAFLLLGKRTAKLATVRSYGRPHVAPVWFILDSDSLVFMTGKDTVKRKEHPSRSAGDGQHRRRASPFAFVLIEGEAIASELSPAELVPCRRASRGDIWEPSKPRLTESAMPW